MQLMRFGLKVLGVSSAVCYIHGLDPPTIHGDIRGVSLAMMLDTSCIANLLPLVGKYSCR